MNNTTEKPAAPTIVPCPICNNKTIWSDKNPHRPFCSETCRNKDFVGWANEEKMIAGSPTFDDIFSGDLLNE